MKGYFRKRGKTWSFTIDIGTDPKTGRRKQKTVTGFCTKKEAQVAAAEMHIELTQGAFIQETNQVFKEFSKEWLKYYGNKESVKVSTVRVREKAINRLLDYFAHIKLKDITKKMYQDALNDLKGKGYADNTIDGIHSAGRMIFKQAIILDLIKVNPTEHAYVPRSKKSVEELEKEGDIPKFLEGIELKLFLKTALEKGLERDYPIFLTIAYTGFRSGELCALKWRDIDFIEQTISITKTYYNPTNNAVKYQLLTPKTAGSKRTISIDSVVIEELKKLKAQQNELKMKYRNNYHDQDFVFAKTSENYRGYPEIVKLPEYRMHRLLKAASLNESLTPHSLRHTHCSLLAESGVGLQEIMERLGHDDDATTKRIYLHVTKTMKKEASHKFAELMKSL